MHKVPYHYQSMDFQELSKNALSLPNTILIENVTPNIAESGNYISIDVPISVKVQFSGWVVTPLLFYGIVPSWISTVSSTPHRTRSRTKTKQYSQFTNTATLTVVCPITNVIIICELPTRPNLPRHCVLI